MKTNGNCLSLTFLVIAFHLSIIVNYINTIAQQLDFKETNYTANVSDFSAEILLN